VNTHQPLRGTALLLTLALAACAPSAGTSPTSVAAPVQAASLAPLRVQGAAQLGGEPLADARVQALDLLTGEALATDGGDARTDAAGRFDLRLRPSGTQRVVRLVATQAGRTLTTLLDGRTGRAIGAGLIADRGQGYRLKQEVAVRLELTLASTAASQAFEGTIKVQLRLSGLTGSLDAVLAAANRAAEVLRTAFASNPSYAARLASAVGTGGKVQDVAAFRGVLRELGVVETLSAAVKDTLTTLATQPQAGDAPSVALTGEDFPVGEVTVTGATFSFVGTEGQLVQGAVDLAPANPAPSETATPVATTAAVASPTPAPTASPQTTRRRQEVPADLGLTVSDRYTLVRVAGDATGGNDAGSGATTARLRAVSGVAVAPDGTVFLADPVNHQLRQVKAGGPAERIAGNADGTAGFLDNVTASVGGLSSPAGLLWDSSRALLLVCDAGNGRVRFVSPGGTIGTLVGGGEDTVSPTTARQVDLDEPVALAADASGTVYVADRGAGRVWRVAADRTTTLVADVPGASALALDPVRDLLWVGTMDGRVLRVTGAAATPALDTTTPVFEQAAQRVLGLATDQQGLLHVLAATVAGDARLWRLPVDAQGRLEVGRSREAVAGSGVPGVAADYVASTSAVEALEARLTALHPGSLCLDLSAAGSQAAAAGQLYVGASLAGQAPWGQVLRVELAE
jgi:sugar lactone lactonase YvrE